MTTLESTRYHEILNHLSGKTYTWCVTGAGGFIGKHLLQALLDLNQKVIAIDHFGNSNKTAFEQWLQQLSPASRANLTWVEGDIREQALLAKHFFACQFVLHQAAITSVPLSIEQPMLNNSVNVDGFLNVLLTAMNADVQRLVYASSSAVYGDDEAPIKREEHTGRSLSPYATSKYMNELYADLYGRLSHFGTIGLRYFNVYGPKQNAAGAYAAVIPRWITAILAKDEVAVYGDGETTRDFCYVADVVQANLLAALTNDAAAINQVYNIGTAEKTTLNTLFGTIVTLLQKHQTNITTTLTHHPQRAGDIQQSLADISKAKALLGYQPTHSLPQGLTKTVLTYIAEWEAAFLAAAK